MSPSMPATLNRASRVVVSPIRAVHATASMLKDAAVEINKRKAFKTYEMVRNPHHVGVSKGWMTWHSQNLEGFRQQQGVTVAQDEVVRRFVRGFFPTHLIGPEDELVIKRRGNVLYVAGVLKHSRNFHPGRIYWMWGFTEEFLSNLLKQPVKLEFQFVEDDEEMRYTYVDWTDVSPPAKNVDDRSC